MADTAPGTVQGLYYNLFKNHPSAFNEFKTNSKGFLQDVDKVGQYDTALKNSAIANPAAYYAQYDQFLKGSKLSGPANDPTQHVQYTNDPSYYRPTQASSLAEWYDYKNNQWKGYGQGGYGNGDYIPTDPTDPIDPADPVATRPSKGYKYGGENKYIETVAQTPGMGAGMGMEYLKQLLGK